MKVVKTAEQAKQEAQEKLDLLNAKLNELKGGKATMLFMNELGAVILRHITVKEQSEVKGGEFYDDYRINLYYVIKGKRKVVGFSIKKKESFVLAAGHQYVPGVDQSNKGGSFIVYECESVSQAGLTVKEFDSFNQNWFEKSADQLKDVAIRN